MVRLQCVFNVCSRYSDLEALGSVLQQYREGHSALVSWIEKTTERQESTQPGQTDSKALSEKLAQQTVRKIWLLYSQIMSRVDLL